MYSVAPTGSISSLIASVRALGERFLTLVTLEGIYPGSPGAWSRVVRTVQVLLPLLMALNSATKAARRPRANISGTAR